MSNALSCGMDDTKSKYEDVLRDAGLTADPFTAELMLLSGDYGIATATVLEAIFFLKQIIIFETFAGTEGDEQ